MAEYISKTDAIHVSRYAAKTGKDVAGYIEHLPAADVVEVVHGKWRHYEHLLTCSVCGEEIYDDIVEYLGDNAPKYCPNCGAKIDGGADNAAD